MHASIEDSLLTSSCVTLVAAVVVVRPGVGQVQLIVDCAGEEPGVGAADGL